MKYIELAILWYVLGVVLVAAIFLNGDEDKNNHDEPALDLIIVLLFGIFGIPIAVMIGIACLVDTVRTRWV